MANLRLMTHLTQFEYFVPIAMLFQCYFRGQGQFYLLLVPLRPPNPGLIPSPEVPLESLNAPIAISLFPPLREALRLPVPTLATPPFNATPPFPTSAEQFGHRTPLIVKNKSTFDNSRSGI
jgi:hypothetical protein